MGAQTGTQRGARLACCPPCATKGLGLTFEVLPGTGQQLVEDMKGALIFGLADGSGFFQKV